MKQLNRRLKRFKDLDELIKHLEWLSRVELTREEEENVKKHIPRILEFFDRMDEIDTENVEPLTHPVEITSVLREDETEEGLTQEEALKNAPEREDGYFKAPRIV